MSEYIKTGKEIVEEGLKRFNESEGFQQLLEWVLVEHKKNIYSGLKEQIENKIGFLKVGCANKEDKIIQLQWVLSLLEES